MTQARPVSAGFGRPQRPRRSLTIEPRPAPFGAQAGATQPSGRPGALATRPTAFASGRLHRWGRPQSRSCEIIRRCRFPSFRGRKPQSRNVSQLQTVWTPVFTGVTTKMDFSQLPTGGLHPRVLARLLARFAGRGRLFNIYNLSLVSQRLIK